MFMSLGGSSCSKRCLEAFATLLYIGHSRSVGSMHVYPGLSLTAGSRQNELATWVICAGYFRDIYVFLKTNYLFLYSRRYMKMKLISHCSLLT